MSADQVAVLLKFLFGRTWSSPGQPSPVLRWVDEPADAIRADLNRGDGVQLEGTSLPDCCRLDEDSDIFLTPTTRDDTRLRTESPRDGGVVVCGRPKTKDGKDQRIFP